MSLKGITINAYSTSSTKKKNKRRRFIGFTIGEEESDDDKDGLDWRYQQSKSDLFTHKDLFAHEEKLSVSLVPLTTAKQRLDLLTRQ